MSKLSPSLRKAAVLVTALDEAAAEALFDQIGAEESAKVRRAIVELDDVSSEEQERVLAEFFGRHAPPVQTNEQDDVLLELSTASEQGVVPPPPRPDSQPSPPPLHSESPLDFLRQVAVGPLADLFRHEPPQIVAVLLVHLAPEQAAAVLERLPATLATDSLERTAGLGELAPEIVADLAHELRTRLAPEMEANHESPASLDHIAAVLRAMDDHQRHRMSSELAKRNVGIAQRLGLPQFADGAAKESVDRVISYRFRLERDGGETDFAKEQLAESRTQLLAFDDLALLDDGALRAVFAAAGHQLVLLALTGADEAVLSRILQQLPAREAEVLRQRLNHPGPIRLRDIDSAQETLATIASRLAREEAIALPASVRFAAAV